MPLLWRFSWGGRCHVYDSVWQSFVPMLAFKVLICVLYFSIYWSTKIGLLVYTMLATKIWPTLFNDPVRSQKPMSPTHVRLQNLNNENCSWSTSAHNKKSSNRGYFGRFQYERVTIWFHFNDCSGMPCGSALKGTWWRFHGTATSWASRATSLENAVAFREIASSVFKTPSNAPSSRAEHLVKHGFAALTCKRCTCHQRRSDGLWRYWNRRLFCSPCCCEKIRANTSCKFKLPAP